jgi:hypothetical protein
MKNWMNKLLVACADVGSIKRGNFGWSDSDGCKGNAPSELATKVAAALSLQRPVALGFECPLFVPLPGAERDLGRKRDGEGKRPWSAGAGCAAMATGLVQATWTLAEIRRQCRSSTPAHLDWVSFEQAKVGLLIWEAFVSGDSKGSGHINDAARAVEAFKAKLPVPETDIQATNPMSLAGFALVWAGWPVAVEALKTPCLVVKARGTTRIKTSEP